MIYGWNVSSESGTGKQQKISLLKKGDKSSTRTPDEKLVWNKESKMVRSGWDAAEASNNIYKVYGLQQPNTKIIKYLKRDKPDGGHQELRRVHL